MDRLIKTQCEGVLELFSVKTIGALSDTIKENTIRIIDSSKGNRVERTITLPITAVASEDVLQEAWSRIKNHCSLLNKELRFNNDLGNIAIRDNTNIETLLVQECFSISCACYGYGFYSFTHERFIANNEDNMRLLYFTESEQLSEGASFFKGLIDTSDKYLETLRLSYKEDHFRGDMINALNQSNIGREDVPALRREIVKLKDPKSMDESDIFLNFFSLENND